MKASGTVSPGSLSLSITDDIGTIGREEWNSLACGGEYSPFLEHEFLLSVEQSGCASPDSGWYPRHFILRDSDRLVAAAPAYVKTHSMGEFIFDQGLARAVMDMGRTYYPKLVACLPFTPAPGYRFLIDPLYDARAVSDALTGAMRHFRDTGGLGSLSILFLDPEWNLPAGDFLSWSHQYFIWENRDYGSFEDYLSRFRKNQRRNIVRERLSVRDQGIRIRVLTGDEIDDSLMDRMYDFYRSTNENFGPWAAFFLNREWFRYIGRHWNHRLLLFTAWLPDSPEPAAMSLVVRKGSSMVGRYWGSGQFIKNLHFELCYYAPVEYAIREGVSRFDPGMGSPHKSRRGFGSREFLTYHDFRDPEIAQLFGSVLPEANRMEREAIEELDSSVPWKS